MAMPSVAILPRVLEKIFAALVFNGPGETKENRSKASKNVRWHAASLMVKIGLKYPLLLLPVFEKIHSTVRGLAREPSQVAQPGLENGESCVVRGTAADIQSLLRLRKTDQICCRGKFYVYK